MIRLVTIGFAFLLLLLTLTIFPHFTIQGDMGLCVSSPNLWTMPRFPGWLLNTGLILLSVLILNQANKKYIFVHEIEPVVTMVMTVILVCNCLTTATISASTILLFINAIALFILFSTFEDFNATRQFFVIGTFAAIGSMFQYAFLFMVPVYIGGGLLMKSFRIRELIAFVFGLIAPYWIVFGFGWVSFSDFHWPGIKMVHNSPPAVREHLLTLISMAILAITAFIIAVYNSIRLFSRNSRLRCMHLTINLMGFISGLALLFDFSNFTAYFGTVAFWFAVQITSLFPLYRLKQPQEAALLVALIISLPLYFIEL